MSSVTSTTSDSTLSLAHMTRGNTDSRAFPNRLILVILSVGYEKQFVPHFGS